MVLTAALAGRHAEPVDDHPEASESRILRKLRMTLRQRQQGSS